ncbi:MAG: CvpA family protein [bacterium]|mgnify:CR=1 FL=1|nr:CvpA family protein [bacterium]
MIDIIVVVSLLAIFKIGYERGIIAELTDIIALILSIIAAFNLTPIFTNLLNYYFHIPLKSYIYMIVSIVLFFMSFFLILAIGYGLELYSKTNEVLGEINKTIGGIVAFIKGILIWWVIFLIVSISPTNGPFKDYILSSFSAEYILKITPYVYLISKFAFPEEINEKIEKLFKTK